ncbi:DNA repair protein [uncultured Roseovarius sp.]|uniref:DNA repair protein n=1 Tax=uncultured Roseovarius sp. TaxID=293344 RepID=UPI002627CEEB|nr:DNA repair protein [uncultured Roseovarius sp.]
MSEQLKTTILNMATLANAVGMIALAVITTAMVIMTILATTGVLPWLELQAGIGGVTYENAGQIAQVGLTLLLLLLSVYLPSAHRVMRLETSHRRFEMNMQDVAQAYAKAHASDRAGLFKMSSEYDAVRERIVHLRNHPDLEGIEPEILELAAQMSQVSQDLATTYSDENVARAQSFLQARQHEIESFNAQIDHAKQITAKLQNWKNAIEVDESVANSQVARLRDSLAEILPELVQPDTTSINGHVVPMPRYAAE